MARGKRGERSASSIIWPGFVDAMTALLLVLMFVLSIFMIVQFVLREELTGKDRSLAELTSQLGLLTEQLTDARDESTAFQTEIASLQELIEVEQSRAADLAASLNEQTLAREELSADLEARVAELTAMAATLAAREQALAQAEATAADLQQQRDEAQDALATLRQTASSAEEIQQRNAELRARLAEAEQSAQETELTLQERIAALELSLDERRAEAERTLTLLAAAEAKSRELGEEAKAAASAMSERDRAEAFARAALDSQRDVSEQGRLAVALLNAQVRQLRDQIAGLRLQLDAAEAKDAENQVVIENLGTRLNQALAQKVGELQRYRSEFFGRLREVLGDREDVRVVGDRFVFQSEVLFDSGSAELGPEGQAELGAFADVLREVAQAIPSEINWILRVDGHTDIVPIGPNNIYRNNWELSQARALSVVEYLVNQQSFPPERLAAAGFGQYQPIDPARTREAFARNRRIELKLTER